MITSRKLQKHTKDGTLSMTMPKNFAETLNLRAGDTVQIELKKDYVKVYKCKK